MDIITEGYSEKVDAWKDSLESDSNNISQSWPTVSNFNEIDLHACHTCIAMHMGIYFFIIEQ
jgi:hypothetical protein